MRADRIWIAAATPICGGLLYFLLAGEVSTSETLAGAVVVVLGSSYAVALGKGASLSMAMQWRAIPALARATGTILPDTVRVGRVLLAVVLARRPGREGLVREQPFRYGGDDPEDAGRRGVVITALSLAPNGYVVGIDEGGDMLLHRLAAAPPSGEREWPS